MKLLILGHFYFIQEHQPVSLETIQAQDDYDYSILMELVSDGSVIRTEDDMLSINDGNVEELKAIFDEFRRLYPGTKRGLEPELEDFRRKHKSWKKIVPGLRANIERQIIEKDRCARKIKMLEASGDRKHNLHVAPWKNLKTYLNQSCWSEVYYTDTEVLSQDAAPAGGVYAKYLERAKGRFGDVLQAKLLKQSELEDWVNMTGPFNGRDKYMSLEKAATFLWRCHDEYINQNFHNRYPEFIGYLNAQYKYEINS